MPTELWNCRNHVIKAGIKMKELGNFHCTALLKIIQARRINRTLFLKARGHLNPHPHGIDRGMANGLAEQKEDKPKCLQRVPIQKLSDSWRTPETLRSWLHKEPPEQMMGEGRYRAKQAVCLKVYKELWSLWSAFMPHTVRQYSSLNLLEKPRGAALLSEKQGTES